MQHRCTSSPRNSTVAQASTGAQDSARQHSAQDSAIQCIAAQDGATSQDKQPPALPVPAKSSKEAPNDQRHMTPAQQRQPKRSKQHSKPPPVTSAKRDPSTPITTSRAKVTRQTEYGTSKDHNGEGIKTESRSWHDKWPKIQRIEHSISWQLSMGGRNQTSSTPGSLHPVRHPLEAAGQVLYSSTHRFHPVPAWAIQ